MSIIEKFLLLEDRPGFPMTFVIQLTLGGQVDRAAWEGALAQALAFQPLLTATLGRGKGDRVCWLQANQGGTRCNWGSADEPVTCPHGSERIDLTQEAGLRVWVRQGALRAVVTLQFHHACTDGIGAYRFIGELLAAYGILVQSAAPHALSDLDPRLLRGRSQRALGREVPFGLRTTWRALRYGSDLYCRRPSLLAIPAASPAAKLPETSLPGYCTFSFDQAAHQRLREVASSKGVMLNDLLLRDLFVTLEKWQRLHAGRTASSRLGIMMPTDLRDTEDLAMPAANMVGYAFLTRAASGCQQPEDLLRDIGDETNRIKHRRSGADFLEVLLAADCLPGLLAFMIPQRWSMSTAVLSNVADPSRRFTSRLPRQGGKIHAGDLVLEDITGVPPGRPGTRAAVSIFQYDRRLTVCLRCDPRLFRLQESQQLLDLYVQQLRESMGQSHPAATTVPVAVHGAESWRPMAPASSAAAGPQTAT